MDVLNFRGGKVLHFWNNITSYSNISGTGRSPKFEGRQWKERNEHFQPSNILLECEHPIGTWKVTSQHDAIFTVAVIYAGFFGWGGSTKCLGGLLFRGWNEILLLGKALKFGVIFHKYALKLIKKLKNYWENSKENANFSENFLIFGRAIKF